MEGFRPVVLGETPLRRVSRPPRTSLSAPIYMIEKLKSPAGRRYVGLLRPDVQAMQKEPGVEGALPRPCPMNQH